MKDPFEFRDADGINTKIDLWEAESITAGHSYCDVHTGEPFWVMDEACQIIMKDGTEYLAFFETSKALEVQSHIFNRKMSEALDKMKDSLEDVFNQVDELLGGTDK